MSDAIHFDAIGSCSALTIASQVRSGAWRARDVVDATLARIEAGNARLNAYPAVTAERARREAQAVDAAIAAGRDPGPLAGVPYAVKNLFDVAGLVTLAGSRINADGPRAASDATVISRMAAAGAVLTGTLNMDEYAYGFTTENSHYGATRNPHDPTRTAGGSSGGSAAAVAAGLVPLALGTDTNGSMRVPAALCGTYSIKPTYGRIGRGGAFPFVPSLDVIGMFSGNVDDLAAAYALMHGPDPRDPFPRDLAMPHPDGGRGDDPGELRVALAGGYFREHADEASWSAARTFADCLGARAEIDIPFVAQARAAAFIMTAAEGGELHLDHLRSRPDDFDPLIRDRLIAGALTPAAWVQRARRFRRRFHRIMVALFDDIDVLVAPATPVAAPELGQETLRLRGQALPLRPSLGLLTQPISFVGLPVLTVPLPVPGLPLGAQLIAAPWREDRCLRLARSAERLGLTRPLWGSRGAS
ncbi:MAG TPA: AtzE family amidohydrolase [Rhodocyclaceae bacterium]|nr:AtzE family amidohydrolase [Rhodocyclaceae bacterium]